MSPPRWFWWVVAIVLLVIAGSAARAAAAVADHARYVAVGDLLYDTHRRAWCSPRRCVPAPK